MIGISPAIYNRPREVSKKSPKRRLGPPDPRLPKSSEKNPKSPKSPKNRKNIQLGCRKWGCNKWGLKGCLAALPGNWPKSAFFALFWPFSPFSGGPEFSTWKIQKTEEKGLFPQISSDFLEPPSLKPPFAAPQFKINYFRTFFGIFWGSGVGGPKLLSGDFSETFRGLGVLGSVDGRRDPKTITKHITTWSTPECTTPSHSQSLANFVANVHSQGISAARTTF